MFNQIRAEFYKLFHTKALYLTFALILAVHFCKVARLNTFCA